MKWRVRKPVSLFRLHHQWHKWFAWYPVRVPTKGKMSGMTKVWLETIERKGEYHHGMCDGWWNWSYRFKLGNKI
jgi:hypothetical protein